MRRLRATQERFSAAVLSRYLARIVRPPRVPYTVGVEAIERVYATPRHEVGGCLHCELDDDNLEDAFFHAALENPQTCAVCRDVAKTMLTLSLTARRKASAKARRYP